MKRICFALAIVLSGCSPTLDTRAADGPKTEPALEAPVMAAPIMDCPAGRIVSVADGIGGTGCR